MLLDQQAGEVPVDSHLKIWFLAGGVIGVGVAILLAPGLRYDHVSSQLVVALWPAAMVQLIDPKTIGSQVAIALIAYGSNFLIYGVLSALIGVVSTRLGKLQKHR